VGMGGQGRGWRVGGEWEGSESWWRDRKRGGKGAGLDRERDTHPSVAQAFIVHE
jgi:hypothetical protein